MLLQAISKIKAEMEANKQNEYIQVVGDFLLKHIEQNEEAAGKIMTEGKTIGKSLDEMKKVAEKKRTGNFAMLTPQEGFNAIMDYFGIDGAVPAVISRSTRPEQPVVDHVPVKQFDVKLEDLLG